MSVPQSFKKLSIVFSVVVASVGFLVFIGWLGNIPVFKSILPGWLSMKANAAICFFLAGVILILVNRKKQNNASKWIVSILSAIIFIMGTLTLLEYIIGFNAGIDELFFKDDMSVYSALPPGRQSPTSAAYFMLFGFCYLPGNNKLIKIHFIQLLHLISGIIILSALMSYVLGVYVIVGVSLEFILIIHSTLSFLLLLLAVLFSQPEVGVMKLVSSDTSGGRSIRKTLPLFVIIFMLMGWLRQKGEQAGLFNEELGISAFIILMLLFLGYMVFSNAVAFTKSEQKLIRANESLELAEQQANLGNWEFEVKSQFHHWSKQMFRLFDLAPAARAPSNKEFLELVHPDDRASILKVVDELLEQKDVKNVIFRTNPENRSLKYLLPTWQLVRDEHGKPVKYVGTLQDVTERVEAKNTLIQREELFSKTFHSKVFGLAVVNKERRIVDINEALTSLIGYSREDFIGKTSLEIGLTDPEYIKKRDELLLLIFMKGRLENYELDVVTRHGKPLSLLLSVEPLTLNNEPHWLIYLVDVTEKKTAERRLAESENQLSTILNTEPECVKIIDKNGELTYMNPAGLAMVEADNFEMVKGRKGLININEPYLKDFYKLVTNVFTEGTQGKMEYEITGFKGAHRWMETNMVPMKDGNEKIISLLSVTRDITERKKTEQKLIESEHRLIRAEKMGNLGHGYYDFQNQQMLLSAGLYDIFGVAPEQFSLTIEGLKSVIHPGDNVIMEKAVDTLFSSGVVEVEFRIVRPDQEVHNVFFKTLLTKNNKGEFVSSFTTALDITERKKAEEQIQVTNVQLRQLAANLQNIREEERQRIGREIHDELGQWLTVLKMEIAHVKKIKSNEVKLNESISEMLKQVDECIQSTRRISTELRPAILDDLGLIDALEWQAYEFGKRTNIHSEFITDIEKLELPSNYTIGIFRIFQESLTNVARHANATHVSSHLFINNGDLVFTITDNGKGFTKDEVGAKKTLGLIGMKERTLLMNGTYNINSIPGKRTEITLIIPLGQQDKISDSTSPLSG